MSCLKRSPQGFPRDDEYEEMQSAPEPAAGAGGGGGTNPFLEVPDASKATEYKRGYVMRKCCVEPNGKRTALGKRSWRMFYCTLRDLVLYMHKDENNSRRPGAYDDLHNAIRVHHALATKAEDYFKKQHVFKLQTADQAEYLLQTSDAKELQAWIDTVNFVAASLSAPPLPGAVGSQKRFQRPLLPSGITKLNLHDQLLDHEKRVTQLETELAEMEQSPPGRTARAQQVHAYRQKFSFLQAEATRYRTYAQLLRSKMSQYPQLEPALLQTPIGELDEEAATVAPPPAAAALKVPPPADRRPAKPTDSAAPEETDATVAADEPPAVPTKEELLKKKKKAKRDGGEKADKRKAKPSKGPEGEGQGRREDNGGEAAEAGEGEKAAAVPVAQPEDAAPAAADAAGEPDKKKQKRKWWKK